MKHNTFSKPVNSIDFVAPEVWEGPGDELHLNDLAARDTPFGGRILSGITGMIVSLPPLLYVHGWEYPGELSWQFNSPIFVDSVLHPRWSSMEPPVADVLTAEVLDQNGSTKSSGQVRFGRDEAPPTSVPATGHVQSTPGRTIFAGDLELFSWWFASTTGISIDEHFKSRVPWPMLVSLGGGLYVRTKAGSNDYDEVVNRAIEWKFYSELHVGETIRGEVRSLTERVSKSRPGWSIGKKRCDFYVEGEDSRLAATYEATSMYFRSQDVES